MLSMFAAVVAGTAALAPSAPPPDSVVAFIDVGVVPMDRERVLTGQTVVVRDGRIAALGPAGKVAVPTSAVRVDGRGKFLIPGLADMHTHIAWVSDSAAMERLLFHYLSTGVTTIRNMEGTLGVLPWRERVASGAVLGPRIYTATPFFPGTMRPDSVAGQVAEYKAAGYDFIKIKGIRPDVLDSVATAARRLGITFAGHALLGGSDLEHALRAGYASVEHLDGYLWGDYLWPKGSARPRSNGIFALAPNVTNDDPDPVFDFLTGLDESKIPEIVAATKRAGTWNCPTLLAIQAFFDSTDVELRARLVALQGKFVKALHDAGPGLLLGTDADITVHQELQAMVAAGLTPYQALETGTRNPAAFWGTLDRTGTIEVGKRADLVLVSGNPLADIRNMGKVAGVMVGGWWLPQTVIDARVAKDQAVEAADRAKDGNDVNEGN